MMAVDVKRYSVTATFTDEEYALLEAFAAEQGIDDLSAALPALLHEIVRLQDQLWDAQFAQSSEKLDAMARKALADHRAGLTEDFELSPTLPFPTES
ncbi:MAG: hypothetical protein IAE80_07870 [Anaerolinea sp.]|nr:hypothetical protein [Anaerolinea sp.]